MSVVILNMPLMMLVMNAATIAVIWFGGIMVSAGTMQVGELISFISYIFHILFSVMMISMVIVMSARAEASAKRVVEVLDAEVDIIDQPQTDMETAPPVVRSGKVEFREAVFKYGIKAAARMCSQGSASRPSPGRSSGSSAAPARARPRWCT